MDSRAAGPDTAHGAAAGARLAPAGRDWDAVRVTRFVGLQAIEHLGPATGPVIMDPTPRTMYFLVPPGTTRTWTELPQCTALGDTAHLVLPHPGKQAPPGPYWLIPPHQMLADTPALRHALETVLGPRPHPAERLDLSRLTLDQIRGWNCALCGARLHADRSLGTHRTSGLLCEATELWACAPTCP
ncbi:MAG TPA: hypothetical protein VN520_14440 [Streptomyces sp.]|uniref:hypothetical protein n=1 Tax=Streptomyces sp. TaxID=1931 RepID=UPI002B777730|nr:hypothetical protein [Streptomyces sp.]HWU07557.1 hypothetical protein [Streptomyces sp.]